MEKQKDNAATGGLSGKIGDLSVFRRMNGKTAVSKIPEQPATISDLPVNVTRKNYEL
jgi:hypothetical protein